ncbi:MAG: serine--tRNA ligase [Acidobacteriia bacterium]|nr:serine--tRNA ligase [Terriglobia bacterium]
MLDIRLIRTQPGQIRDLCKRRKSPVDFDAMLALDEQVRKLTTEMEELRRQRNEGGGAANREAMREAAVALRQKIGELEERLRVVREQRDHQWSMVPNFLAEDTPAGADDKDNVELTSWGEKPDAGVARKTHEVIGKTLGIIDEERGTKVSGSGYTYWVGDGARLAWGLYSLALDYLVQRGFRQMFTPVVTRERTLFGTGYLPFFRDQIYHLEGEDLNLIGTSEQTMVGYHMDETLAAQRLPLLYTSFSPCFRTEAGSYGKETRGMFRQHQFHKVEQIVFCTPETSDEWLEKTRENVEGLMRLLDIPYRVVRVCEGDMGAPGYKKYDVEGWFAGFGSYRETHSCTNLLDYQARRLNIKAKQDKTSFVPHTISSTMITDRALLAILENNQTADGSVMVPKALRPWVDGRDRIEPVV